MPAAPRLQNFLEFQTTPGRYPYFVKEENFGGGSASLAAEPALMTVESVQLILSIVFLAVWAMIGDILLGDK